ncbi:hypothetical protein D9757_011099 [Collybiopsis confluens]|uniref:Enoyl reductase (ER) domain-containing protein n=1 Tax=Collybiopsis confluens TaxID=2823264 RepID=A0A8H5LX61_9AGAR|nr:hypothetical protein D9757_011099 [Collybiopsis confluens]
MRCCHIHMSEDVGSGCEKHVAEKALILAQPQAPLVITTMAIPKPGPGDVLVKIKACALNPVDLGVQAKNIIPGVKFPTVLGLDAAGDVEEVGEGVNGFVKGERVFFPAEYGIERGGFQQYALARAEFLGKIPNKISYAEASTIPLAFTTAAIPLLAANPVGAGLNPTFDPKINFEGEPALVIAGGTSVGQFAIQIYKYLNFNPIIVYASSKHTTYLTQTLGATHVVDRSTIPLDNLPEEVKRITKDKPVTNIYVAQVFTPDATEVGYYKILGRGGQMATAHPSPSIPTLKESEDGSPDANAEANGKKVYGVFASPSIEPNREFGLEMWKRLPELVKDGIIKVTRVELLPGGLAAVSDALPRFMNGGVSGVKLVFNPQEVA